MTCSPLDHDKVRQRTHHDRTKFLILSEEKAKIKTNRGVRNQRNLEADNKENHGLSLKAVKIYKPGQDIGEEITDRFFLSGFWDTDALLVLLSLCHVIKLHLVHQHSSLSSTNYTQTCWDRQQRRREKGAERYYIKNLFVKSAIDPLPLWIPAQILLGLPLQMFIPLIHLLGTFPASLWQLEAVGAVSDVVWPQSLQQTHHSWLPGRRGC